MGLPSLPEHEVNILFENRIDDLNLEDVVSVEFSQLFTSWKENPMQFILHMVQSINLEGDNLLNYNSESNYFKNQEMLIIAASLLNLFVRENYTGPPMATLPSETFSALTKLQELKREELIADGEELVENVKLPMLILIAEKLLSQIDETVCPTVSWWKLRVYFLHQRLLDEKSQIYHEKILKAKCDFERLSNDFVVPRPISATFYAELSAVYAYYYDIEGAKESTLKAKELAEITAAVTGVMGKRTRFQQMDLAQLVLKVDSISSIEKIVPNEVTRPDNKIFPHAVPLDDEVRLEKINVNDKTFQEASFDLSEIQHLVILTEFQLKKIYLPNDEIYREELLAYLSFLIGNPKVWCIQMVALLNRSTLEKGHRRTVERSMLQLQTLSKAIESPNPSVSDRLRYFYATSAPMSWEIEVRLGEVLISLNLFKEALDIWLRLKRWEDVIQCYTDLSLRHKAEEVIREQLEKNNTVKLWTLLGDATDNIDYYKKAWELSGQKSARAKRQWGFHHFQKKQFDEVRTFDWEKDSALRILYEEAVRHLEESLKLNPLENPAWLRLGFAALEIENWEVSAKAYQHSTSLDADNFEAWNNLAKAFVKMGHKVRALRALREATKCNFDNWKVWENTLVVALDCRAYDEVILAYNRLFDLKGKWVDDEVLSILTSSIVTDKPDSSDNSSQERYLASTLRLFGRITATITNNPRIWKLYSELLLTKVEKDKVINNPVAHQDSLETTRYRSVTFSQRAVQAILADPDWSKSDEGLHYAIEFCSDYIKNVQDFIKNFPLSPSKSEALVAAQFTVKRIYSSIKKLSESAIQPKKFEKFLNDLKENAAGLEGIRL